MAQLVGLIVSEDRRSRSTSGRLLRSGAIPVSVLDERAGPTPPRARRYAADLVIVDTVGRVVVDVEHRAPARRSRPGVESLPSRRAADPDLICSPCLRGQRSFSPGSPDEENIPRRPFDGRQARRETAQAPNRPPRRSCSSAQAARARRPCR